MRSLKLSDRIHNALRSEELKKIIVEINESTNSKQTLEIALSKNQDFVDFIDLMLKDIEYIKRT